MKIEAEKLKKFLEKINIKNKVTECKLNFEEEGISTIAKTSDNICMLNAKMANSAFVEYEAIGKIGIANIKRFTDVLERFSGEIATITKEKNMLKINAEKREADLMLPDLEFIEDITKTPKLEYAQENIIKIDTKLFSEASKNAEKLISETGEEKTIQINSKNGLLVLETGTEDKMREIISIPNLKEGLNIKFSETLGDIISLLSGNIEISLKTNYPITINKKGEQYKINYVVAPIVETGE